jgi:2-amino-4-hydroxy-6-hydroxymethyldihydropteridine diphosphokinase
MTTLACIGLGSNLGQPRNLLLAAWRSLAEHPNISLLQLSSPYRTKPVAMDSPHWFINAAGLLRTSLPPEALLDVLLETEQRFGRIRFPEREGYQDRTLDLDLLLVDGVIIRTERLTLPHPFLHERMFVLAPLAEIAPQFQHPLLKKTIAELLAELEPKTAQGDVERMQ